MKNYLSDNRGAIALTMTIILGAAAFLIIMTVTMLGISARTNAFDSASSEITFVKAEGCLEEALLQLSRDETFSGADYDIDGSSCSASVSGADNQRAVMIDASEDDFYQHFEVEVQLLPEFAILSFRY